jgi:hypothetical protein
MAGVGLTGFLSKDGATGAETRLSGYSSPFLQISVPKDFRRGKIPRVMREKNRCVYIVNHAVKQTGKICAGETLARLRPPQVLHGNDPVNYIILLTSFHCKRRGSCRILGGSQAVLALIQGVLAKRRDLAGILVGTDVVELRRVRGLGVGVLEETGADVGNGGQRRPIGQRRGNVC